MHLEKSFPEYIRLSEKFDDRKLEAVILKMEPQHIDIETMTHFGEEFYYILSGSGVFTIDSEEYLVNEGETIHYPSFLPHKIANPNDEQLVRLCVVTPPIF